MFALVLRDLFEIAELACFGGLDIGHSCSFCEVERGGRESGCDVGGGEGSAKGVLYYPAQHNCYYIEIQQKNNSLPLPPIIPIPLLPPLSFVC